MKRTLALSPDLHSLVLLLVSIALLLSGVRSMEAQTLAVDPANSHYLVYHGQPTLVVGSSEHYGAVINLDFDYTTYLNEISAEGLNYTRLWVGAYRETSTSFQSSSSNTLAPAAGRWVTPWARSTTSPGEQDGGYKFDLSTWDPNFFSRLNDFLTQAQAKGIIVELNLFCPYYLDQGGTTSSMWNLSPINPINNINNLGSITSANALDTGNSALMSVYQNYVQQIVTAAQSFDNVYFEPVNEPYVSPGASDAFQQTVIGWIAGDESSLSNKHLIDQNADGQNNGGNEYIVDPRISILNLHYATVPAMTTAYNFNKVAGDNETDGSLTADQLRKQAWEYLMSGAGLYSNLDFSFTAGGGETGSSGLTLRQQFARMRSFVSAYDFSHMTPSPVVVGSSAGTAYALGQAGVDYIAFVDGGASTTLTLALPAGTYTVNWMDTVSGATSSGQVTSTGSNVTLSSPGYSQDIAVGIKNQSATGGASLLYIDLGNQSGSPIVEGGATYVSDAAAGVTLGSGTLTYTSGNTSWTPSGDAAQGAILNTQIYTNPGSGSFTVPLASGNYLVSVGSYENYATNGRNFDLLLNGQTVASNIGSQAYDYWTEYGPYSTTVDSSGILTVGLTRHSGDPSLSYMKIIPAGSGSAPAPPGGLSATAASATQINLNWTASTTSGVTYSIFRSSSSSGFTPSAGNQIASDVSGTTYSDSGLTASTAYYYAVEALNPAGASTASNQAGATTLPSGGGSTGGDVVAIDSAGPAVGVYAADQDFSSSATYTVSNTIDTSNVVNPAPQSVYQSQRYVPGSPNFTYTIPGLTPGATYTVRLHFAELYYNSAGARQFNVVINGMQVLTNFDIFAAAGGEFKAIAKDFTAIANSSGQIVIAFNNGAVDNAAINGIEIQSASDVVAIDVDGPAAGSYAADEYVSGGNDSSFSAAVDTSAVVNPPPAAVYQNQRWGNFTYTIPGLTAGATYTVRLHFAEEYFSSAGQRQFNLAINGLPVLTNFDILATAGGMNKAIAQDFTAIANPSGQIVLSFTQGAVDNPTINAIEIQSTAQSGSSGPSLPDMIVSSISMSPANSTAGQPVTFSAVVQNQGTAATPAGVITGVGFLVDGTEVSWSGSDSNSIAPGASVTLTADGGPSGSNIWTATAGTHTIEAYVNDVGRYPESNTGNNTLSQSFTVASGSGGGPSALYIDLGGPAETEAGVTYISEATAEANGLALGSGTVTWSGISSPVTPSPAVDAAKSAMLNSGVYSPNGASILLTQSSLAPGNYQVSIGVLENYQSNVRSFNLQLNGQTVASNIGSQAFGGWTEYGPYNATVGSNGQLSIGAQRLNSGDPTISYINIVPGGSGAPATVTPNDPDVSLSPALTQVKLPQAWAVNTSCSNVLIGMIGVGVDTSHPDLAPNLFQNPNPNDMSQYPNDVYGWDFWHADNNVTPLLSTDAGGDTTNPNYWHETFTTGILGAAGNNGQGSAGVCWTARIILAKKSFGQYPTDTNVAQETADAINYLVARQQEESTREGHYVPMVINNSYAVFTNQQDWLNGGAAVKAAIDNANSAGVMLFFAADNYAQSNDVSTTAQYPASYASPNVISVAALYNDDTLSSISNYGVNSVQISAPGIGMYSTNPEGGYSNAIDIAGNNAFTSFATPLVAGAAALYWSLHPSYSMAQVRAALLNSADNVPGLNNSVQGGRRLNVGNLLTNY